MPQRILFSNEGLIMDQRVQIDDDNLDRNGTDC